jgi:hypothetical protein
VAILNDLFQQALKHYRFTGAEQREFLDYLELVGVDPESDDINAGEVDRIINDFFTHKFNTASE